MSKSEELLVYRAGVRGHAAEARSGNDTLASALTQPLDHGGAALRGASTALGSDSRGSERPPHSLHSVSPAVTHTALTWL